MIYLLSACNQSDVGILEGLEISGLGIVLIMAVLSLLMGCIYALSAIIRTADKKGWSIKNLFSKLKKKDDNAAFLSETAEVAAVAAPTAPGSAGDLKLNNVEPKTAAMVMAIVADELQTPVNELHFISIKEIESKE